MSDGSAAAAATTPIPSFLDRQAVIGGKTYILRFSVRCMQAFREVFGLDSDGAVGAKISKPEIGDLPKYLFGLTRTHHPELTLEDCAELADAGDMMKLGSVCGECFRAHSAPADKKKALPTTKKPTRRKS